MEVKVNICATALYSWISMQDSDLARQRSCGTSGKLASFSRSTGMLDTRLDAGRIGQEPRPIVGCHHVGNTPYNFSSCAEEWDKASRIWRASLVQHQALEFESYLLDESMEAQRLWWLSFTDPLELIMDRSTSAKLG